MTPSHFASPELTAWSISARRWCSPHPSSAECLPSALTEMAGGGGMATSERFMENTQMTRENENLENRIAALEGLNREELRRRFTELYGFEAVTCSCDNLRKRIAYRLQELEYGGLSQKTLDLLESIAAADALANLGNAPAKRVTKARGARYVRVWNGRTYEVSALGDGRFEYDGRIYGSLTAVAEQITGTHWSGKRFFGVK